MEIVPNIIFLLFINSLKFITFDHLIKNIIKMLKKVVQTVVRQKIANIVIYNIVKIEIVFFFEYFVNY